MLVILVFIIFLVPTYASCPYFLNAYKRAKQEQYAEHMRENQLMDDGFIITKGQPGYTFYTDHNVTHLELLHNADLLYRAEQLYDQLFLTKNGGPKVFTNKEKIEIIESKSWCLPLEERCQVINEYVKPEYLKYRTIDGKFNHLENPMDGASFTALQRLLPSVYDDGINSIRKSVNGQNLPSPRLISNTFFNYIKYDTVPEGIFNSMSIYFGQAAGSHDFSQIQEVGGKGLLCCAKDYTKVLPNKFLYESCLPIEIPVNDPFYSRYNMTCQNFVRSYQIFRSDCKLGQSQTLNKQTSFLDISNLYGSTIEISNRLRTFSGGKMKTNKKNILPNDPSSEEHNYLLGDERTIFTPILSLQISIFLRLHNNIADQLASLNPFWDDEKLFQETRRINIAIYQHIFYTEYIPLVLSTDITEKYRLTCKNETYCGEYNPDINPATLTEYSAVFRTFHGTIPTTIDFYDTDFKKYKNYSVIDVINEPEILQFGDNYIELLRGAIMQNMYLSGYNQQFRTTIFNKFNRLGVGIDLNSIDLQRGRDHGHAPYIKYMELCQPNLGKISKWDDLKANIKEKDIITLKKVYNSVNDVDLFVGLYLETEIKFGPVGNCIIANQYYNTKFGDRFFYSFKNGYNPFTEDQLKTIMNYSFAQLLCQQTKLEKVTRNAFHTPSKTNIFVNCSEFPNFDLSHWQDNYVSLSDLPSF